MSGMSKKKWKIAALLALSCLVMSPVLAFDAGDVARLVETRSCPGGDLRGATLKNKDLTGADLTGADLSYADLSGAVLEGADLSKANLQKANLRKAGWGRPYTRQPFLSVL